MKIRSRLPAAALRSAAAMSAGLNCDLSEYQPSDGLAATVNGAVQQLVWQGDRGWPLRAFITDPRRSACRRGTGRSKGAGRVAVLARDLTPEFEVTSGRRRISEQQMEPLRQLGILLTPDLLEAEKWKAFWDAPLEIPGAKGTNPDLPRKPEEIRRAKATGRSLRSVMTDRDDVIGAVPIIGMVKPTTSEGLDFQHGEQIVRHATARHAHRFGSCAQVVSARGYRRDGFERARRIAVDGVMGMKRPFKVLQINEAP